MALDFITLRSGLQFLSCETGDICRLCLKCLSSSSDNIVELNQTLKLTNREYYDEPVTLADVFVDLGIPLDETLPQLLCETCTVTVVNGFLLPKLLAHSKRTWYSVVQHFEENLEKVNQIKDTSNALFLPSTDSIAQFLFMKRLDEDTGKPEAISILKDLKPTKLKMYSIKDKSWKYIRRKKLSPKIKYESREEFTNEIMQCQICQKFTKTKKAFKDHLERAHGCFSCATCLELQPSRAELKKHKSIHKLKNNVISVVCPKCNKTYANKITFRLHQQICGQQKSKQFICDYCKQSYIRKNSLRTHIKTSHGFGKLHSCNWCQKKFDAISKLKEHVIKHTQVKKFTCEFCGIKCGTAASLACHIRLHTGEKPFPCNLCDEKFLSASRRIEHVRRKHVGPHKECHICTAKYYSTNQLKKHLEGHSNPHSKLYLISKNENHIHYDAVEPKELEEPNDYQTVGASKDGQKFYVYMVPAKS